MNRLRKKPVSSLSRQKDLERKNLYLALKTVCEFSDYKDLLLTKEKAFTDLCGVDQIEWNFKKDSFINQSKVRKFALSTDKSFPFCLSLPLEYRDWNWGELIFSSNKKITLSKKRFLHKITGALSSSVYFMENKSKQTNLKYQWNVAFDSFYRALCITDENYKILKANQTFARLVDLPKKELFGQKVFESLKVDQKKTKKNGFSLSHTVNARQLEIKSSFLNLEENRFILLMASDVTEENRLQEQLSKKARETELGFIRGSIAHELNNPLSGMKTLVYIMEKAGQKGEAREIIQEMKSALNRCQQIVKNLLQAPFETKNSSNNTNFSALKEDITEKTLSA